MKPLFENNRYIASTFLTILMVFGTYTSGYANNAPVFTEGGRAKRTIAENTAAGTNIGTPVAATDADGDVLTYSLGGVEGSPFFSIDTDTGQLQTKAPLDYEAKNSYAFAVHANDGNGGRVAISVTIDVTDVDETPANNAPVFTDGSSTTRTIAENTATGRNIGTAIAATDADNDVLTYTLGGTDASAFHIVSTSGQLQTRAALDYETKTSYSLTVSVSDGNEGNASIDVAIRVTDVNETPSFPAETATRTVAENTASGQNIGDPFEATDPDRGDTLIYSLHRGDRYSFSIDPNTGQLRTKAALDFETKNTYNDLAIRATDSEGRFDAIFITISVTDVNETPSFPAETATRTVAENTASGQNIGDPFEATDPDRGDTLIYSLHRGDRFSFRIDPNTGQLRTHAALDFETKKVYNDLAIRATDSEGRFDAIFLTINVTNVNEAPTFTDGRSATRTIAENTASGENIGTPVTATDPENDTLTYTLGGDDASAFSIISTTGQLQTRAALDYETKHSYSVMVSASGGNGGSESITVIINVTDVNEAPTFTDGDSTTRSIAENTAFGTNIGTPVVATDVDANTTLVYTLGGTDASSFSINGSTGQLQTRAALDYETDASYSVTVSVSDGNGGSDSIDVTITVTDVNENRAPVFADGDSTRRTVEENTASGENIGSAVAATDADTGNVLTYTLGGTDASVFNIVSTSGQLQTNAALDYETKSSYSVTVSVSDDNGGRASIDVAIRVTDVNETPSFPTETDRRTVAEDTAASTNIGDPFQATDPDSGDTLTYSLHRGDRFSFRIDPNTGQLQTKAALDFETKNAYNDLAIRATDSEGRFDAIFLTINVTNVNEAPSFTDGTRTTRAIAENTASGQNIGTVVAATDPNSGDTLRYTLGGDDASAFSIVSTSGQLQTNAALDYETKNSYSVTVTASDSSLTDTITVTIHVRNVNEAPSFADGRSATRVIAENTAAGENIGAAVAATDVDANTTLAYTLGGTDAAAFSIVSTSGQLQTNAALDYETKSSYAVTVSVSDGNGGRASIDVTISVTDVNDAPVLVNPPVPPILHIGFYVAENRAPGTNIGTPIAVTDADGDTLTYSLSGDDAASFSIVSTSGQLQTNAALDYETKTYYSITVSASDGNGGSVSIGVRINVTDLDENRVNSAPVFVFQNNSRTLYVAENTASGTNFGTAFTATDADNDILTYSLSGTDAAAFSIVNRWGQGQLQTRAALDYETKSSYSVTISVSDDYGGSDSVDITIRVLDVDENRAPVFTDGASTTLSVAENTASGTNFGAAFAATDADNDTLTYSLSGDDAAAFRIGSTSGQLQTNAALDHETKSSYSVTVSVSDSKGGSDSITVTINITDINEALPSFIEGSSTTRAIAENTVSGTNIGTPVAATDRDDVTLIYSLGGDDAAAFSIDSPTGQLQTSSALDYETKNSYSVTVSVSDGNGGNDSIEVTIDVTDVNENRAENRAPVFTDGIITTRIVLENTASNTNIGTAVAATDADSGDTLTYTLSGTDAAAFSIVSTSGQLQTRAALDYETKSSYSVTVSVSDGNGGSDSITVTIYVSDVQEGRMVPVQSRTPAVRDAIVRAIPGVSRAEDVTAADLAAITELDISWEWRREGAQGFGAQAVGNFEVIDLQPGDFSGFTNLRRLSIWDRLVKIRGISGLSSLTKLEWLSLGSNRINDISALSGLTKLKWLNLGGNNISDPSPLSGLTNLVYLSLQKNSISDISALSGLTKLEFLHLHQNYALSDISPLSSLTKLTELMLGSSSISDISPLSGLTKLETLELGYSFISDISVLSSLTKLIYLSLGNNNVSDISAVSGLTKLYWLYLENSIIRRESVKDKKGYDRLVSYPTNSISDVSSLSGLTELHVLRIKNNPISDYSPIRTLRQNHALREFDINLNNPNNPPVFTEGSSTTRTVAENTAANTNIGTAVAATDADTTDTLTYSLASTDDAESFSIVSTTGQLRTKVALDFETKNSYTVTVTVSDGNNGGDRIIVTIDITDAAGAPSVETLPALPETTALLSNFPNPFNPETWIPYQLATPADVTLTIYDIRGVVVRELKLGHQAPGFYQSRARAIHWDGRNMYGEKVASGLYFYTLTAGDFTATRKLLIRK